MKRRLSFIFCISLLCLCFVFAAPSANAAEVIDNGTCGSGLTWELTSDGVMTISGKGAMKDYSYGIPWSSVRDQITSLVVEEGVTTIGQCTFDGCTNLKTVSLPSTLTTIKMQAFSDCSKLEQINLPTSLRTISTYAFMDCDSLTRVVIPEGVTTIGHMAFALCDELVHVEIPGTVSSIAATVNNLGATLPFISCPKLEGIWVAAGNKSYCSDEQGVLFNRNKTKLIEAPGGLAGEYVVPDTVTEIGLNAFQNCNRMTGITIPAGVATIGSGALAGCDSLETITVAEENTVYASDDEGFLLTKDKTTILRAPGGYTGVYVLPSYITTLEEGCFSACKKLTGVELHEGVSDLGKSVFANCTGLKEMDLPEGHTTIGERCFYGCTALERVNFPETLTSIHENAFENCTGLTEVKFPQSLHSIYDYAFECCTGLKEVVFPKKLTRLGYMAFARCTGLEEIRFSGKYPTSGSSQRSSAFSRVEAIAYYPEGSSGWTETAMTNMSGEITWYSYRTCGENLTWSFDETTGTLTISGTGPMFDYARNNSGTGGTCDWESLKEQVYKVVIEEGVTTIADYAFYSFDNLAVMTLPSTLKSVGKSCCYVNDDLHHVLYGGTKEQWEDVQIATSNNALTGATRHYETDADAVTVTIKNTCSVDSVSSCSICRAFFYGGHTSKHTYEDGICTVCGSAELWVYKVIKTGIEITGYNGTETGELTIPDTFEDVPVSSIGYTTFQNNRNITGHLSLPSNLQSVGTNAFAGCWNITSLDVPATLVRCYSDAFSGCTGLNSVHITDLASWCGITFTNYSSSPLYYGKKLYLNGELVTKLEIPQGVTEVKKYAFCLSGDNEVFTAIVIPDSVTSIGVRAFDNCKSVKNITFAGNAPAIAEDAFKKVTANAWYRENDLTWTVDKLQNYGGTLTWNKLHIHTEELLPAREPDCTKTGLTAGAKCSVCGAVLTAQETIPASGHTKEDLPAVSPTCGEPGLTTGQKCSVCGEVLMKQESIPATGHSNKDGDHLCDVCGFNLFEVQKKDDKLTLQYAPADLLILMASYTGKQMTDARFLQVSDQIELPETKEQICVFFLSGTTYAPYCTVFK